MRRLTWCVALMLAVLPAWAGRERYPAPEVMADITPVLICARADGPSTLDARDDEAFWQQARPETAWVDPTDHANHHAATQVELRMAHDDGNLYVFFAARPLLPGMLNPAGWRVRMTMDPRPDHINTPWVELRGDGSATSGLTTWKTVFRKEQYEALPKPHGAARVEGNDLLGEFAIPFATLMADSPAAGDEWDLDFELRLDSRTVAARWGTDFITGRLRFGDAPPPAPTHRLVSPSLPVTPHQGRFPVSVSLLALAGGPPPTELTAEATPATGVGRVEPTVRALAPVEAESLGAITLPVEFSEPGWGAVRFELKRGGELVDALVLPLQVEPALERFADLPSGSLDLWVKTLTIAPGDAFEGQVRWAPAQPGAEGDIAIDLCSIETLGRLVPNPIMSLPAGRPATARPLNFSMREELPCGHYRVVVRGRVGGEQVELSSPPINVAGELATDCEAVLGGFEQRVAALAGRELTFPEQRDSADILLRLLRRHGPDELTKLSAASKQARGWWPVDWAVQLAGMLDALEADRDYFAGRSGVFVCAYRSEVDGTLQPFQLTLPQGWERARQWPVLFGYHGTHSHYYYSLIGLIEWGSRPITQWPVIGVGLEGRAQPSSHNWMADVDFLECHRHVLERYSGDPARVSMTGFSRGGRAVWLYGTALPHLFSAIAPIAPFGYMHTGELPNVRNMSVLTWHAVDDPRCAVGNGAPMVDALEALGGRAHLTQVRLGGHDTRPANRDPGFMQGLIEPRVEPYPRQVEFVLDRPRYARAYWVTIERLARYGVPARVAVSVTGDSAIEVTAQNVAALSLDLGGGQVVRNAPLTVTVNGDPRRVPWAERVVLDLEPVPAEPRKSPELAGPIGDWMFAPSIIAYGTEAGEETTTALRRLAEQIAHGMPQENTPAVRYVSDYESEFPVRADSEVTAGDIARANLVLVGGPGANAVATRIADRLPVSIAKGAIAISETQVTGEDAAVAFIHPNPEAPQRYVVVLASADPARTPAATWRTVRELGADLMVLGGRPEPSLPARLHFDGGWRLQPPRAVCGVPAGNQTTWHELCADAVHARSGAELSFRFPLGRATPVPAGPLFELDARTGAAEEALVAMSMTGAQFESYLQSWITLYGEPPLLRGMQLRWSADPANTVVRIESSGLEPGREYTVVADEVSATRACWDVPDSVRYRLLPLSVADAVLDYLAAGGLGRPLTQPRP